MNDNKTTLTPVPAPAKAPQPAKPANPANPSPAAQLQMKLERATDTLCTDSKLTDAYKATVAECIEAKPRLGSISNTHKLQRAIERGQVSDQLKNCAKTFVLHNQGL